MSDLVPYKFAIIDDIGQYVYYNEQVGVPVVTSTPVYLKHAPKGWMEEEIKWNRSLSYFGLTRTHSTPYEFVEDAAKILRMLYHSDGIEADYKLRVLKLEELNWTYELYYEADIDFSMFNSSGDTVRVNLAEGGISKYIRGNDETSYEIPIQAADCVNVKMDGIILEADYNFIPTNYNRYGGAVNGYNIRHPLSFLTKDGSYSPGTAQDQSINTKPPFVYTMPSVISFVVPSYFVNEDLASYFLFKALTDLTATYEIKQRIQFALENFGSTQGSFKVFLIKAKDVSPTQPSNSETIEILQFIQLYQSAPVSPGQSIDVTINTVSPIFNMNQGDFLYLCVQCNGGLGQNTDLTIHGNPTGSLIYEHKLKTRFRLPDSVIKGYRLMQVFDKITEKVSEGNYTAQSAFLSNQTLDPNMNFDNIPYQTILTCGDAVRGLTKDSTGNPADPKIKTSFSDFFKALQCLQGVGLGMENNKLVIEPIEYFFRTGANDLIYDFGDIPNIEIEPASEYLGNLLKIGYPNQNYDGLNGRDEVNSTQEYKYPIKRINKEINKVSPYRADMYGIEYTRANLLGKETTDSESDNDNFFISIDNTLVNGAYGLYRPTVTFNSGLIDPPSAFNLDLSPKRCALRNGSYLRMQNYPEGSGSKKITFQKGEKNVTVIYDLGSGLIQENQDITVTTLRAKPFLPILVKFTTSTPASLLQLINQKPYGYFQFTHNGYTFKGFGFELSVMPMTEDVVEVSLLLAPDTDVFYLMVAANSF